MATEIEQLIVKLEAETSGFRSEMKSAMAQVQTATAQMGSKIDTFAKTSTQNTSLFTQSLGTLAGTLGAQVVGKAVDFAIGAFKDLFNFVAGEGVAAANAEEAAVNRLAIALQSSGKYSQQAVEDFRALANQMEETTGIADDQVISAGALIGTIAQLGGQELQQATKASADLAAVLGIDLESSARLVAKAIIGKTETISRYGIAVEEGKTKSETFANVLGLIAQKADDAASKLNIGYAAAAKKVSNETGNFGEAIATVFQNNPAFIASVAAIGDAMKYMGTWVSNNSKELQYLVQGGIQVLLVALQGLNVVFAAILKVLEILAASFNFVGKVIAQVTENFYSLLTGAKSFSQFIEAGFTETFRSLGDLLQSTFNLDYLKDSASGISELQVKVADTFGQIEGGAAKAQEPVGTLTTKTQELSAAMVEAGDAGAKLGEDLAAAMDLRVAAEERAAENKATGVSTGAEPDIELATLQATEDQKLAILQAALEQKKLTQEEYAKAEGELKLRTNAEIIKLDEERNKKAALVEKQKSDAVMGTLSSLASFQGSKSKELAAVGKAAAIAQATMDTYAGANKALASSPPPYNFIQAAAVVAAGIGNVSKIASTPLATGADSIPGVGSRDNFPAVLAPGERVLPTESNKKLTEFLDGGGNQGVTVSINVQGDYFEGEDANLRLLERIQRGILQTGFKLRMS
jgi:hypothetical protein